MGKSFFLSALLFMLTCSVGIVADEERHIFHECKPFPNSFLDSVPFLLDFARWIAWFFGNLFNGIYFVLNTVVITICEVISNIFGCLKYAIKLVEYLGCGVRAILQLNYNVVSSIFEWLAKSAQIVTDSVRSLTKGIISGILSVFQGILSLISGIVSLIPTGFYHVSHGSGEVKNATSVLLYRSYLGWKYIFKIPTSALLTIATNIRAVIECLVMSIWNTAVLLVELLCSAVTSIFLGIEFVGKTVQTCAFSALHHLMSLLKWLWYCFQSLLSLLGRLSLEGCRALIWVIDLIFGNILRGIYVTCKTIGWVVYISLNKTVSCSVEGLTNLPNLIAAGVHRLPGGKWSLLSFVSTAFLISYCWTVLRVNLFTFAFGLLETSLQGVLAFIATLQAPKFMRRSSCPEKSYNVPTDEKDQDLKEQLEREKDRNMCVVCQSEEKNVVVMPCRHMCMCKSCCTQLFRMQRHQRKACPLCRHTITSTLEIYS